MRCVGVVAPPDVWDRACLVPWVLLQVRELCPGKDMVVSESLFDQGVDRSDKLFSLCNSKLTLIGQLKRRHSPPPYYRRAGSNRCAHRERHFSKLDIPTPQHRSTRRARLGARARPHPTRRVGRRRACQGHREHDQQIFIHGISNTYLSGRRLRGTGACDNPHWIDRSPGCGDSTGLSA